MPSTPPLSYEDALAIVLRSVPQMGSESVSLGDCRNRVLFEDIAAPSNLPPFDNSAMDGFALRSADTTGASPGATIVLRVIGESSAGSPFAGHLNKGEAVRIMTGALVPDGSDAVLELEKVSENDSGITLQEEVAPGRHIRKAGEDMKTGEMILRKGALLSPSHIGVLAALGMTSVGVSRKPSAAVVTTGSELVGVAEAPEPGQVRNSSRYMIPAFLDESGATTGFAETKGDDESALMKAFKAGLDHDLLLTTGGVSVGKYDLVLQILKNLEVDIRFHGVNIKPGRPMAFGVAPNGTPVFCLPGNPVSSAITFFRFVKPAIHAMMGREENIRELYKAVLEHDIDKKDTRRHYVRGVLRVEGGRTTVRSTGNQSSGVLTSLIKANCLIVLPAEERLFTSGEQVDIEFL